MTITHRYQILDRLVHPTVRLYPLAQPTISDNILAATAMTPGANCLCVSDFLNAEGIRSPRYQPRKYHLL